MTVRHPLALAAATLAGAMMLSGCVAGENTAGTGASSRPAVAAAAAPAPGGTWSADTLTLDFATYNPLSLIIKDQGWLEAELGDAVHVEWVQSAGSNKANEALRAGAIDVGSTAGSAALLARANGSPIKTIDVYTQPEWSAIVVPKGSPITSVAQLAGKRVAATKGTDPYFFLLQSLQEAGVPLASVDVENLQHADGRTALEQGAVDAWAGLDPLMAASQATAGSTLLYRNVGFNSYGVLNATEDFLRTSPDLAQLVVDAYERARAWAIENPEKTAAILADVAGIDPAVATTDITERTRFDIDPIPGEAQHKVLSVIGPIFVEAGDVASQDLIDRALGTLLEPAYASKADPSRFDD